MKIQIDAKKDRLQKETKKEIPVLPKEKAWKSSPSS